jgi:hypothetical protein
VAKNVLAWCYAKTPSLLISPSNHSPGAHQQKKPPPSNLEINNPAIPTHLTFLHLLHITMAPLNQEEQLRENV